MRHSRDPKPFDKSRLTLKSLENRPSIVKLTDRPTNGRSTACDPAVTKVIDWLIRRQGPRVWFLGAHAIKANLSYYLHGLIQRGLVSHLALTGAGLIHDWELATCSHTSEDVATAIKDGSFGMWEETAKLNDLVSHASEMNRGLGEFFRLFLSSREGSVIGCCYRYQVPVTIHVAIGQDIVFQHPNCDGAAWGHTSYQDFLVFAETVSRMQGGTYLSFGSAVASPEIFLKALAMARNAQGGKPDDLAVAVLDRLELPQTDEGKWFNRPFKSLLQRIPTESAFVHAKHEDSIPFLWQRFCK